MNFAEKLIKFRAENNLTQKQLADLFNVNVHMIFRYEKGLSQPIAVNMFKFEKKMKEYEVKENV